MTGGPVGGTERELYVVRDESKEFVELEDADGCGVQYDQSIDWGTAWSILRPYVTGEKGNGEPYEGGLERVQLVGDDLKLIDPNRPIDTDTDHAGPNA